jgi:hypothetical protein
MKRSRKHTPRSSSTLLLVACVVAIVSFKTRQSAMHWPGEENWGERREEKKERGEVRGFPLLHSTKVGPLSTSCAGLQYPEIRSM